MSREPFNITFGKCPRCGSDGGDYAASDISSADSSSNIDISGNGVKLELFRGDWLCPLCIKEILANEETKTMTNKRNDVKNFLGRAGFGKTIT